jgi:membrane-associated protease RseP (regulator of RpoE activity)
MRRILLTGAALLGLSAAAPPPAFAQGAGGAHRPAPPLQQSPASGAWVEEVIAGAPAARAGIRAGDVIIAINGATIADYADLDAALAASGGRALTIEIDRGERRLRLRATPILALMQSPYAVVRRRWVLGVSHTDYRMVPCWEEPDCE